MSDSRLGQIKVFNNFQDTHPHIFLQKRDNFHPGFGRQSRKTLKTPALKLHCIDANLYVVDCQGKLDNYAAKDLSVLSLSGGKLATKASAFPLSFGSERLTPIQAANRI